MGWFNNKEEVPQIAPAPTLPELPKKESEAPKNNLPELPSFPGTAMNENLNQEIVKSAVADDVSPVETEVNTGVSPGAPVAVELPGGAIPPVPSVASGIPELPVPTASEPVTQAPVTQAPVPSAPVTQAPVPSAPVTQAPVPSAPVTPTPVTPTPATPTPATPTPTTPIPTLTTPPTLQKMTLELNATKENRPITKPIEPIYIRIDKFQAAQKNFETVKDKITEIESLLQKVKDVKSKEETELNGWAEDIEKIKARLAEVDSEIFNQL